jgi:hypothetical protein
MKEGAIGEQFSVVADDHAAQVAQLGKRAFALPAFVIASHGAAIIGRWPPLVFPMEIIQQHPASEQSPAQQIAGTIPKSLLTCSTLTSGFFGVKLFHFFTVACILFHSTSNSWCRENTPEEALAVEDADFHFSHVQSTGNSSSDLKTNL